MDAGFLLLPEHVGRDAAGHSVDDERSYVRMRRFAARERVFLAGGPVNDVFELVQGAVLIVASLPGGRRQILDIVEPGRLFGLSGVPRHRASAIAAAPGLVCALNLAAARRNPRVAERIHREMYDEIERLRNLATSLGRMTAIERVADFFLRTCGDGAVGCRIHLPVTRQELADHLGLTIETISRNVTALKREGAITAEGAQDFRVVDADRLRTLAGR